MHVACFRSPPSPGDVPPLARALDFFLCCACSHQLFVASVYSKEQPVTDMQQATPFTMVPASIATHSVLKTALVVIDDYMPCPSLGKWRVWLGVVFPSRNPRCVCSLGPQQQYCVPRLVTRDTAVVTTRCEVPTFRKVAMSNRGASFCFPDIIYIHTCCSRMTGDTTLCGIYLHHVMTSETQSFCHTDVVSSVQSVKCVMNNLLLVLTGRRRVCRARSSKSQQSHLRQGRADATSKPPRRVRGPLFPLPRKKKRRFCLRSEGPIVTASIS